VAAKSMAGRGLYFGFFEPDEDVLRALVAAASDEETETAAPAVTIRHDRGKRDWVAKCTGRSRSGGARGSVSSSMGAHDRARVKRRTTHRHRKSRPASPSAPAPSRDDTRLPSPFRSPPEAAKAARRARRRPAAPACSRSRRRRHCAHRVWLGDIDSDSGRSPPNANAPGLNDVGEHCKAVVSRGVQNRALGAGGALTTSSFANILAKPLRLLAPSLAAGDGPGRRGDRLGPSASRAFLGVLASWRAQGFHLAERIDLEGLGEPAAAALGSNQMLNNGKMARGAGA